MSIHGTRGSNSAVCRPTPYRRGRGPTTIAARQDGTAMATEKAYEDTTTPLGSLQEEISSIIETFVHLGVQVHDFQGTQEAKLGLANHINKTISKLHDVSSRDDLRDIMIPTDLLNYIQDGRNPDIYTREFVEVVRKINQYLNGKSLAFENFRDTLAASIKQEFPELAPEVDSIKAKTSVSASLEDAAR